MKWKTIVVGQQENQGASRGQKRMCSPLANLLLKLPNSNSHGLVVIAHSQVRAEHQSLLSSTLIVLKLELEKAAARILSLLV